MSTDRTDWADDLDKIEEVDESKELIVRDPTVAEGLEQKRAEVGDVIGARVPDPSGEPDGRMLEVRDGAHIHRRPATIDVATYGAVGDATSRSDSTGATDDTQAFIAAAQAAQEAGAETITAPPGVYHCPGLTAEDMGGVWVVGDGVEVTKETYILPVTTREMAQGVGWRSGRASLGRGMLAIEHDDAWEGWWEHAVPEFKKRGVVGAIAWPTDFDGSRGDWIPELHRHGWEIQAHGTDHEDFAEQYTTRSELHAVAQEMLDAIEAVTGQRDNVSFVYPFHSRNELTDDVLRQYFSRGRGQESSIFHAPESPGVWLMASRQSDDWRSGLDNEGKAILDDLASEDGRLVVYLHNTDADQAKEIGKVIDYALSLGIVIAQPRHVHRAGRTMTDRYFDDTDQWNLTGTASFDTDADNRVDGDRSLHADLPDEWNDFTAEGAGGSGLSQYHAPRLPFSVMRASYLYKATEEISASTSRFGVGIHVRYWRRREDGGDHSGSAHSMYTPQQHWSAADFDNRITQYLYVPHWIPRIRLGLDGTNVGGPNKEMWFDDVDVQKIDEVGTVNHDLEMENGDTGRVAHGVVGFRRGAREKHFGISITPFFEPAGRLYLDDSEDAPFLRVRSTDPGDSGTVMVSITAAGRRHAE